MFVCEPCAKDSGLDSGALLLAIRSRGGCEVKGEHCIGASLTYDVHHSRFPMRDPLTALAEAPPEAIDAMLDAFRPTERIINPLVWLDCETTGLEPGRNELLEFGMIATDEDLEPLDIDEFVMAIQPANGLDLMKLDPTVVKMHTENGLFDDMRSHSYVASTVEAKAHQWLDRLETLCRSETFILAGSTIPFDRGFIRSKFPRLYSRFHYRSIDVSTVKELVRRWYGEDALPKFLEDQKAHRPIPDIEQSIEELRFYRQHYFMLANPACRQN